MMKSNGYSKPLTSLDSNPVSPVHLSNRLLKEITIEVEEVYLVNSTIKNAKKNLKKLIKIYDTINLVDYKYFQKNNNLKHIVYYETWFMFMDDIVHIQKDLIEYFENEINGEKHQRTQKELVDKIKMLLKPISIEFSNCNIKRFTPPSIKLFVPEQIYEVF